MDKIVTVADSRGCQDATPSVKILSFSCSFRQKFWKIIGWCIPRMSWGPPLGNPRSVTGNHCFKSLQWIKFIHPERPILNPTKTVNISTEAKKPLSLSNCYMSSCYVSRWYVSGCLQMTSQLVPRAQVASPNSFCMASAVASATYICKNNDKVLQKALRVSLTVKNNENHWLVL